MFIYCKSFFRISETCLTILLIVFCKLSYFEYEKIRPISFQNYKLKIIKLRFYLYHISITKYTFVSCMRSVIIYERIFLKEDKAFEVNFSLNARKKSSSEIKSQL